MKSTALHLQWARLLRQKIYDRSVVVGTFFHRNDNNRHTYEDSAPYLTIAHFSAGVVPRTDRLAFY